MPDSSLSFCATLVRDHDYDRYLCTLFAPPPAREDWFALCAFNHEVAAIAESVKEEMIAFVRFAWWREALDEIYAGGKVRKHPVAEALAVTIRRHALPRPLFDEMLEARQARLVDEAFTSREQWEAYFRATSSSLLALCAQAAGTQATAGVGALGVTWGALGTARLGNETATMLELAEEQLQQAKGLPACLAAFRDAAHFYLNRMKKGKATGREARFWLTLYICRKRLFG